MIITGATEKKERILVLYMCAQRNRKKKAPKWVTTQQKKGVKNCTPNKIIQKKAHKFIMNESDRQELKESFSILLSFILNI
jgi:hypothetical protein